MKEKYIKQVQSLKQKLIDNKFEGQLTQSRVSLESADDIRASSTESKKKSLGSSPKTNKKQPINQNIYTESGSVQTYSQNMVKDKGFKQKIQAELHGNV